jgi:hypothetical protein
MCNGAVNLALDWDPKASYDSQLAEQRRESFKVKPRRAADDISSIVLANQDGAFIKSDATY